MGRVVRSPATPAAFMIIFKINAYFRPTGGPEVGINKII
jgi:hypothetical protein